MFILILCCLHESCAREGRKVSSFFSSHHICDFIVNYLFTLGAILSMLVSWKLGSTLVGLLCMVELGNGQWLISTSQESARPKSRHTEKNGDHCIFRC